MAKETQIGRDIPQKSRKLKNESLHKNEKRTRHSEKVTDYDTRQNESLKKKTKNRRYIPQNHNFDDTFYKILFKKRQK